MSTYLEALAEIGVSAEQYRMGSEELNLCPMPDGWRGRVCVKDSAIEGKGPFAEQDFKAGEDVAPLFIFFGIKPYRTETLGRYVNHADQPNTRPNASGGMLMLVAARDIRSGEELTVCYSAVHGCCCFMWRQFNP